MEYENLAEKVRLQSVAQKPLTDQEEAYEDEECLVHCSEEWYREHIQILQSRIFEFEAAKAQHVAVTGGADAGGADAEVQFDSDAETQLGS